MGKEVIIVGYKGKNDNTKTAQLLENLKKKKFKFIDVDTQEGKKMCKKYNIDKIPVTLFFADGDLVDRRCGLLRPKDFDEVLKEIKPNKKGFIKWLIGLFKVKWLKK